MRTDTFVAGTFTRVCHAWRTPAYTPIFFRHGNRTVIFISLYNSKEYASSTCSGQLAYPSRSAPMHYVHTGSSMTFGLKVVCYNAVSTTLGGLDCSTETTGCHNLLIQAFGAHSRPPSPRTHTLTHTHTHTRTGTHTHTTHDYIHTLTYSRQTYIHIHTCAPSHTNTHTTPF
jgi:hypothetical protein